MCQTQCRRELHGLESQETRCREYATRKGYTVIKTFYEKAVSGGTSDRPYFNDMLDYVQQSKIDGDVVIIDDISRFARDIEGHWAFHAPTGYKYAKVAGHGKLPVLDEPLASIAQEALEEEFAEVVRALQPSKRLYDIALAMFKDAWAQRLGQAEGVLRSVKQEITKTDKQIEALLGRIVEASHPKVIGAYETKLVELEQDKLVLAEKLHKNTHPQRGFDEMFELACRF